MDYSHPQVRRTARRIPILCAAYFVLFAFLFLYLLQSDVLAQIQFQLSQGETISHPLFAAGFCTFLLTLLGGFLTRLFAWLPLRMKAMPWFFPFLLVGLLTCWRFPQYGDMGNPPHWWAVLLWVVVYGLGLFVAYSVADSPKEKGAFSAYAWPNALLLILFTFMSVSFSNTDIVLHGTLRAARLAELGAYDEVLQCAQWERHPSRQFSVATTLALSETQQMGNQLFAYPQPHGVAGLLPEMADTSLVSRLPHAVARHLGYKRGEHTPPLLFLQVIDTMPKASPAVRDYLLCAYLLERRVDDFAHRLLLNDSITDSLPLHYREALMLRQHLSAVDTLTALNDESLRLQYLTFDSLRNTTGTKQEREFRCRRQFGATYWYYYFFR